MRSVSTTTTRDSPQAFALRVAAARSVQCLGTSDTLAEPLGFSADAEWRADLEHVWRSRVVDVARSLTARARRRRRQAREVEAMEREYGRQDVYLPAMRIAALRSAEWADHRARSLTMARADIVASCGQRWRGVKCGCGIREMKVGCDQPQLCGRCRRKHSNHWRKKIIAGMERALREERSQWWNTPRYRRHGMKPGIYLITLTAPHSGDLNTDREGMGEAVRKLLKHATKHQWWRTYALTWEATGGANGEGHMHAHLAVISSWIPYSSIDERHLTRGDIPYEAIEAMREPSISEPRAALDRAIVETWLPSRRPARGLHEVWRDAMPGAFVLDVQAPSRGPKADDALTAGVYLAKYVTKGVDAREFTGRKAGELLIAFRGRRKVSTSADFWVPPDNTCECCGDPFTSTGAPCSLQELLPGAVLRSMAERAGWFIPRGDPQVALRWSEGRDRAAGCEFN